MLDIKKIRQNPDLIKELLSLRNPHYEKILNELLEIDKQYREKLIEKESLEAERNTLSKTVGQKKSKGENADSEIESLNGIKEKLKAIKAHKWVSLIQYGNTKFLNWKLTNLIGKISLFLSYSLFIEQNK